MAKAIESLSPLDEQITKVNHRLKLAQLGLQIERRGKRLGLRGISHLSRVILVQPLISND